MGQKCSVGHQDAPPQKKAPITDKGRRSSQEALNNDIKGIKAAMVAPRPVLPAGVVCTSDSAGVPDLVGDIEFSPDGARCAVVTTQLGGGYASAVLTVLDVTSGAHIFKWQTFASKVSLSANGKVARHPSSHSRAQSLTDAGDGVSATPAGETSQPHGVPCGHSDVNALPNQGCNN